MLTTSPILRAFQYLFPKAPRASATQREAVRRSIGSAGVTDALTRLLCDRLAELDPPLSGRLADDLTRQCKQMIATIEAIAVDNGEHHARIAVLRDLERTQARYGMTSADYDSLGAALTLALQASDMFDDSARDGWITCFDIVAFELKAAARWRSLLIPPP